MGLPVIDTVEFSPPGLPPVGMEILGNEPSGTTPASPVLVGVIRHSVSLLLLSAEQITAVFCSIVRQEAGRIGVRYRARKRANASGAGPCSMHSLMRTAHWAALMSEVSTSRS